MESSELNQFSADDSRLEARLRASSATTPLPDDGFTARVLAALPPSVSASREVRRRSLRRRWWFCLGGATLVVAFWPDLARRARRLQ